MFKPVVSCFVQRQRDTLTYWLHILVVEALILTDRHGENTSLAHILVVEALISRQTDMVGTLISLAHILVVEALMLRHTLKTCICCVYIYNQSTHV